MGEFFNGGCFVIINTFFTVFLTDAIGMSAALAGTIPLVGKIWDAITDPIMGNITDRTRSKLGPKRLYILIGAFASSITFVMLWLPVHAGSAAVTYMFYLLMYCLFSTGFTVLMVPYNGLLPDMVDDYAVRFRFSNVRMIWSTLAVNVFLSRSFRIFVGIYLTGQCGMDFVSGMAVFYVNNVLGGSSENHYLTYLMAALIVSQLIGMLIWGPVMAKTSKRTTILIGAPVRIISTLALFPFSHTGGSIVPILILAMGIGIGNAATLTSIFAILADMADVDELITGVSRPGTVSGMATFARKVSAGISAWLIGVLLGAAGYQGKLTVQAPSTVTGIKLIFILMPVILVALLFFFGYIFPMKRHEFDVIKKEIARRKGLETSETTEEEKRICEKVTGVKFEKLWDKNNIPGTDNI
ncbi:MAG: MFS transporter [Lachnospiraceae bacterium]|nr:MFS transporter [Lachnospiraceae bacterium]